jgi:hypothetical protein
MKNKNKFKLIHYIIKDLGYELVEEKCSLALDRVNQTGFLKYILYLYLFFGNIFKKTYLFHNIYKKIILYKFLAGVVILVFESDTNFENVTANQKANVSDKSEIFDTIVIGSGPGGSIAALRLIQNNERVLIIEAGRSYNSNQVEHHSLVQTNLQFYKQGMNFCYGNMPMLFAEGSTYGGGSEVNSGLYFKLAEPYRSKLLEESNITEEEWKLVEKKVENILSVQTAPEGSFNNLKSALITGSKNIGITCEEIPRWREYSPLEVHKSMQASYLKDAEDQGLMIVTETEVIKLEPNEKFITVICKKDNETLLYKSKKIVLSAGTIGTPKILKNSRLIKDSIKFNFHPMTRCVVDYGEVVNHGDLFPPFQSWTKDNRFKFGYSVSTFPFVKATLASLGKYDDIPDPSRLVCYFSSTVLDNSYGKLLSFNGKLIPFIYISKKDKYKIKEGFEILKQLLSSTKVKKVWPSKGLSPMTSVHIFGSLPIGKNKDLGLNGELINDSRIKISDASLLPTAPWGNPQAVLMVLNEILISRWINQNKLNNK